MNKFIEVTEYGQKILINVSNIVCITENRILLYVPYSKEENEIYCRETYEEIKTLIGV